MKKGLDNQLNEVVARNFQNLHKQTSNHGLEPQIDMIRGKPPYNKS